MVIVRPYFSPDPSGPKYEEYCRQKLMLHIPFRREEELLGDSDTYAAAYAIFLQSGNVPPSLEEDIHQLEQHFSNCLTLRVTLRITLRYMHSVNMYMCRSGQDSS